MKTIEERAKEFANARWPKENFKFNDRYRREHYQKSRDTYIQIATEQKAIDIEKVCKWLKSKADECFVSGDSVGEHLVFKDLSLAEFLKAMEE